MRVERQIQGTRLVVGLLGVAQPASAIADVFYPLLPRL
jgi:hypothetical protein